METNEKQVSRNIKSCRQKVGLTQEMIAKELDITTATYINIENNPLNYSINKLTTIADALGCSIDDFLIRKKFTKCEK